jgi:hypothetical protein
MADHVHLELAKIRNGALLRDGFVGGNEFHVSASMPWEQSRRLALRPEAQL